MAYSFITSASGQGDAPVLSFNSTGGDFIIVAIAAPIAFSPTDNKGNSFTTAVNVSPGGLAVRLFYCANANVGTGHTVTCTSSNDAAALVAVFSGGKVTSPLDAATNNNGTATSIQPGSITPSENECLMVAALAADSGVTGTINSGFTLIGSLGSGDNKSGSLAYKIQTTAGAENPTWTASVSSALRAAFAAFKAEPFGIRVNDFSSASEGQSLSASMAEADTSTASDGQSAGLPSDTADTATASEDASFSLSLTSADTATATEGQSFAGTTSKADTATAGEASGFATGFSEADVATVTETPNVGGNVSMTVADTATVSEDLGEIEPTLAQTYILTEPLPYGT